VLIVVHPQWNGEDGQVLHCGAGIYGVDKPAVEESAVAAGTRRCISPGARVGLGGLPEPDPD